MDRDDRISEIFYHFEHLTTIESGRTMGRKLGVVQEIMLRKYLESDEQLRRRLYLEQLLIGFSGASHKVEFSWFAKQTNNNVTPGVAINGIEDVRVIAVNPAFDQVSVEFGAKRSKTRLTAGLSTKSGLLAKHLAEQGVDLRVVSVDEEGAIIDVIDRRQLIASLESKRVGAQRFSGSENLGSGIQTIEKAKQASLVAIDLDLKHNGTIKPLREDRSDQQLISLVALGNGIHWTTKDKAVLGTYADYTFVVSSQAVIRYAEFVAERAGDSEQFLPYFMSYFEGMTKVEPDDFEVSDSDFTIATPSTETRTIKQVLLDHVLRVNPQSTTD
jgi:hypothetical protein